MSEMFPGIKQISQVGNDMYGQGAFPVTIGTTDVAYLADPADTMLLAGRDPVIHEVSVGISGEEASLYDVSGTPPLSLPNSLGKPLKGWEVELLPYQNLNGYDSPWPAGGGVNKFDASTVDVFTVDSMVNVKGHYYTDAGTYYIRAYGDSSRTDTYIYARVKNSDDSWSSTTYIVTNTGAYLGSQITISSGQTLYVYDASVADSELAAIQKFVDWQMQVAVDSSMPDRYYPYSNICPIYGTDELNLFVEESYDPTATPKAVITLPSTIYSGSVSDGGAVSNWGEVDLGTLNWRSLAINNIFYCDISDLKNPQTSDERKTGILSDEYKPSSVVAINNMDDFSILRYNGYIYLRNSAVDNSALLPALLSGVKLVYELATPTTLTLTTPDIPTPTGNATTWATAEDGTVDSMEVTYVGKA